MMDETTTSKLFSDVKFVIAECQDADSTKNLLIDNGAKHINYLSEHVTLVISDVICLEADEAMNIFEKPIVSSLWVHLSLKAKRLLPPEAFCPYRNIFQDVIASLSSDLTPKDRNVLACTLTFYGARVSNDVTICTHFIVPDSGARDLPSGNLSIKVVAPDWVLESVRQNSCCEEELFEPSLLLPPPPPRLPTPPPPPPPPQQEIEPSKPNVPSNSVPENNSNRINQSRAEYTGNTQHYQPPAQTRVRQPFTPVPQQTQVHNIRPPMQHPPLAQHHNATPDVIRHEPQSLSNPQQAPQMIPQNRSVSNQQRPSHPQMQSQVSARFQSPPQMRVQSPHTQQPQHHLQQPLHHPQQHPHPHPHQQQQQQQQQQQHYQHVHQHQPHQQHTLGHSNQAVMQVGHQSQPGPTHRMIRPQAVTPNHLIDQKQNNMRPIHPPQMTTVRHQQPDQASYDNFNQSNQRRAEYVGTPPQYPQQALPRVRQPYSPMQQQTQVHQIQTPIHHASMPQQHQHVSPDRIHPEYQSQANMQPPQQMLPQTRPQSNLQHQPHPRMQAQSQFQPMPQHQQSPQNQHHQQHHHQHQHGHPAQAVMQMRPISQPGIPHQGVRPQSLGPHVQIDQKQNSMPPLHSSQITMRHPQPEQVPYDNFNQSKFAGDSPQYQHPRPPQPYQHAPQQAQTHRIQSPIQPTQQQHQLVSPDRIQIDVTPHHGPQQSTHPSQNQPHQLQLGATPQAGMQLRPASQPGTSQQIVRPQTLGLSNQMDQKQNNVRPMNPSQMAMNSPRLISSEESVQPQPHPSIFDHSHESNLAQIKSKVPKVNESVQYFGHDSKQNVPKNQPLFGCKFKLVEYSDIEPSLKQTWSLAITGAGGVYCNDLIEATHLICETRNSPEYLQAVKLNIRCVTIYWINDIITLSRLTHPWKALHLPLAYSIDKRPMTDHIITVTNFRGNNRREVREMILKTGAKFTDYFSSKNTLIICGAATGDKYDRAVEWKVPLANCQFLSDVLLFGAENIGQLLAQSKYKNFTRKDPFKLASHPKIRDLLQPWEKPIPLVEPKASLSATVFNGISKDHNPADPEGHTKLDSNTDDAQPDLTINGIESESTTKPDIDLSSENNPAHEDIVQAGIVVEGLVNCSEVVADFKQPLSPSNANGQKLGGKENSVSPPKRFRKSHQPIRLLYTNVASDMVELMKDAATKLGLCFATNHKDCTHLLVGKLCRTRTFICSFSHASYILSPSWLLESSAAGELLDEKPFLVQDREGEEKYSFNLVHSLVKRKRRSELLFNHWVFFITPSVKRDVPDIEGIIESAGGSVCSKKPPTKKQVEQLKVDGKRMVVVTCDEDFYLCSSLESSGLDVVNPEFVISGILRQDIDFDVHRIRKKARLDYT